MQSIIEAFSNPIMRVLPKLPVALMTFLVGLLLLIIIKAIFRRSLRSARTHRALAQMIVSLINFVLWVILLAAVLYSLDLGQIAFALSGSVAVIGIIIATGTNTLVTDVIAGLSLAGDKDFNVGYRIKSADVEGVIEKIDLRKIRVRDDQGKLHVVPNALFDKAQWVVLDDERK